jgi:hypothetical protein
MITVRCLPEPSRPALGLYVVDEFSNATQSPSPECTHVDDFFTYFPELEKYDIPNAVP